MEESQERRRTKRLNRHVMVRYYFDTNTDPIQVYTEDLSSGGMRIHNPFPINVRYKFPMQIILDQKSSTSVRTIARVAWQRKNEETSAWDMGLEFIQMHDSDKECIEKFVSDLKE